MSKNNSKLQELQVEVILNKIAAFIAIKTTLTADEDVDTSGLLDYITRRDALELMPAPSTVKSLIPIVGNSLVINWQTDFVPGTDITYFQKHGNSIGSVQAVYNDGAFKRTSYTPNYSYTYNVGEEILILTFVDLFPGLITII